MNSKTLALCDRMFLMDDSYERSDLKRRKTVAIGMTELFSSEIVFECDKKLSRLRCRDFVKRTDHCRIVCTAIPQRSGEDPDSIGARKVQRHDLTRLEKDL